MKTVNRCKVELIDSMGSDLSVVNAARVSFDKASDWDTGKFGCQQNLKESDQKLIDYLAKHGHWSPFTHCFANFRISAPIFVARQLAKHQVGLSWNEVSRRYVDSEPEFYFPQYWRKRAENVKQGSSNEPVELNKIVTGSIIEPGDFTAEDEIHLMISNMLWSYNKLLEYGVAPEQARMILPQNTMTSWIWSGSLYAFARVCKQRLDSHAQQETAEVVYEIDKLIQPLFPHSWEALKGQ